MTRSTRNIAGLGVGLGLLLGTAALARRPISKVETRVFRGANGLPEDAYRPIWVPMQYGTFGTVPAAAILAFARRRPRLALAIAVGGTAAWLGAKAVKPIMDRARPASIVEGVALRGAEQGDRGFPSGHAAVSAVLTVVAWPYLSDGWRVSLAALPGSCRSPGCTWELTSRSMSSAAGARSRDRQRHPRRDPGASAAVATDLNDEPRDPWFAAPMAAE